MHASRLDGNISRLLEGGVVSHLEKTRQALTICLTNGERWPICLADPATGEGIESDPVLVGIESRDGQGTNPIRSVAVQLMAGVSVDGHLTKILAGKTIESMARDGQSLVLKTTDHQAVSIGFVQAGEFPRGEPCLLRVDVRARPEPVKASLFAGSM
jgi:hypothetical protein